MKHRLPSAKTCKSPQKLDFVKAYRASNLHLYKAQMSNIDGKVGKTSYILSRGP